MADQFDEFLDEVQQDIKQEKYLKLWKEYGKHISTAAVVVLGAAASYVFWQNYQQRKHFELSDAFLTAQNYAAQNKMPEAIAVLDRMKVSDSDAYGYLKQFQKAALLITKKSAEEKNQAVAIYDKMSKEKSLPVHVRDYATFLLAKASHDMKLKKSEEVIDMLKPLCADKNAWKAFSLELTGMIYYLDGKYKEALEIFADLVKQENLPEGLHMRVRLMTQVANQNVNLKA